MDEIMTVEEVAAYLKVSKNTVRRWCVKEKLPAFKIDREWRINKKELEQIIRQSSRGRDKVHGQTLAIATTDTENETLRALIGS